MDDDIDESSGSDFDDDEDPDKIQVPGKLCKCIFHYYFVLLLYSVGGGKDLAAAAGILESRESRESKLKEEAEKSNIKQVPMNMPANSKFPPNFQHGFDMMRNATS